MDNNMPRKQKADAAVPQPTTTAPAATPEAAQPEQQPAVTPVAPMAAEPKVSKQQLAVMRLVVGLKEQRNIEVGEANLKQDGKFIVIALEGWPEIAIGTGGGYTLPQVRSYAKADLPTMLKADELWRKQQAREQKKAAATAPPAAKTATPAPAQQSA